VTRVRLTVPVDVAASQDVVWHVVTDWERQGEWMPATRVEVTSQGDGWGLGATVRAVTGVGPVGFTDTMEVVEWDPPHRCVMRHTGRLVRGEGVFEVVALPHGRSRFLWSELLDIPFGVFGRAAWALGRPVAMAGLALALRRLARRCEAEHGASA
jgi:carbon monoxide dehydrogenase subunit G